MLKEIRNSVFYGTIYCGLEHTTIKDQNMINVLLLKKQKKELYIDKEISVRDIEETKNHIDDNQHAYLIINDAKVIGKKINEKLDLLKAVKTVFPNIKLDEFYYESYSNENDTFVNVCRKDYVHRLLRSYKEQKISILGISLGNNIVNTILPYYDGKIIETSNAVLALKNGQIADIVPSNGQEDKNCIINGLTLRSKSINAFSGIVLYLSQLETTANNFSDIIHNLKTNFNQRKIFENGLKFALGFLFTILLVNFLIFTYYNDKINKVSSELMINQQYEIKLNQLKTEVDKKKKIVDEINSADSNLVSYYLDGISKSIPKSILLNEINFQPIKNIKQEKEIEIEKLRIILNGSSIKGEAFSSWIAHLESLEWINEVSVSSYGLNKKSVNEFELKIML